MSTNGSTLFEEQSRHVLRINARRCLRRTTMVRITSDVTWTPGRANKVLGAGVQRSYVHSSIKYSRVITNQQLYDVTKCEPLSIVTERRRLSWLGHLMRLNPETPAWQSCKEALRQVKRKPGRPPMTWITPIQQDLSKRDIHINLRDISAIEKLESMGHDRVGWKARCSMREPRETSPLSSVSARST